MKKWKIKRHAGTWLSRSPLTKMKKIEQVRGLSVPNLDITVQQMRLRWMETSEVTLCPLQT